MEVWVLLTLAGSGVLIGFLSGLVGIGGGVLIVPLLYFFYGTPAWSGVQLAEPLHAVVAHATSLFVIVPTSALGTWTYHRAEAIAWRAALPIAATSILAALATTQVAPRVPAPLLKLGFGLVLLGSGLRMLRARPDAASRRRPHPGQAAAAGVLVGVLSALLGVGGGIIAIPVLIYFVGLRLDHVAATSMAVIAFTALAAVAGYAVAGDSLGLPPASIGYVHYGVGIPIIAGALLAVQYGARVNQRTQVRTLRLLFAGLFVLLGLWLVVSNALALPGPG